MINLEAILNKVCADLEQRAVEGAKRKIRFRSETKQSALSRCVKEYASRNTTFTDEQWVRGILIDAWVREQFSPYAEFVAHVNEILATLHSDPPPRLDKPQLRMVWWTKSLPAEIMALDNFTRVSDFWKNTSQADISIFEHTHKLPGNLLYPQALGQIFQDKEHLQNLVDRQVLEQLAWWELPSACPKQKDNGVLVELGIDEEDLFSLAWRKIFNKELRFFNYTVYAAFRTYLTRVVSSVLIDLVRTLPTAQSSAPETPEQDASAENTSRIRSISWSETNLQFPDPTPGPVDRLLEKERRKALLRDQWDYETRLTLRIKDVHRYLREHSEIIGKDRRYANRPVTSVLPYVGTYLSCFCYAYREVDPLSNKEIAQQKFLIDSFPGQSALARSQTVSTAVNAVLDCFTRLFVDHKTVISPLDTGELLEDIYCRYQSGKNKKLKISKDDLKDILGMNEDMAKKILQAAGKINNQKKRSSFQQ